jgi:proteasome alpha subunit
MKPYEVEIVVGEIAIDAGRNEIYHILFDGTVTDEQGYVAIGGHADELTTAVRNAYEQGWDLATGVRQAVTALRSAENRQIEAESIEVGVLDRTSRSRRTFRRLEEEEIAGILSAA